jgi:hypothetical protein
LCAGTFSSLYRLISSANLSQIQTGFFTLMSAAISKFGDHNILEAILKKRKKKLKKKKKYRCTSKKEGENVQRTITTTMV